MKSDINTIDFIITGCNRSGTTLLSSMIASNPNCVVLNEHYECNVKVLGNKKIGLKAPIPRMDYLQKKSYSGIQIWRKIHKYVGFWWSIADRGVYAFSLDDFIQAGKPIVFIYRDLDENVKSILSRTQKSAQQARWEVSKAESIRAQLKNIPGTILEVALSDLTRNPSETLIKVCGFLGLQYDECMSEGYKNNFHYASESLISKR